MCSDSDFYRIDSTHERNTRLDKLLFYIWYTVLVLLVPLKSETCRAQCVFSSVSCIFKRRLDGSVFSEFKHPTLLLNAPRSAYRYDVRCTPFMQQRQRATQQDCFHSFNLEICVRAVPSRSVLLRAGEIPMNKRKRLCVNPFTGMLFDLPVARFISNWIEIIALIASESSTVKVNAEDSDITYTVLTIGVDVAKAFILIDTEYNKAKRNLHAYAAHASLSTNYHD